MFWTIHLVATFALVDCTLLKDIQLPSTLMLNQSLSSRSTVYLCHVHQLKNSNDIFLRGYQINDGENTSGVHHLLLYECSTKVLLQYSGLCGKESSRFMPLNVYQYCQTRIIVAWAQGGKRIHHYPKDTGLKLEVHTQLLLEVHFENRSFDGKRIGVNLKLYPSEKIPRHEIGVLTVGTLAKSTLFLPPRLDSIRFPTYCSRECLNHYLENQSTIYIFSILVHAHRRAIAINLERRDQRRLFHLVNRTPFEFHRQEITELSQPYPQLTKNDELSLICTYSTRKDSFSPTYGGHDSNDEMCQAFLYYYPKIESFPLCLSLPIYHSDQQFDYGKKWTDSLSNRVRDQLESTRDHWTMCGDNVMINQTNRSTLRTKLNQYSMKDTEQWSIIRRSLSFSVFYVLTVIFFFLILYFLISTTQVATFILPTSSY